MAVLKQREAVALSKEERIEKIKTLQLELVKKSTPSGRGSKIRTKEIKKALARLLTLEHSPQKNQPKVQKAGGKQQ